MPIVNSFELKGKQINKGKTDERIIKIIASPDTKKMCVQKFTFGISIIRAGGRTDPHSHEGTEECIYVATGRGQAKIAGQSFQIEPETCIMISPGKPHSFLNSSDETMKLIWVYSPPGAEKSLFAKPK